MPKMTKARLSTLADDYSAWSDEMLREHHAAAVQTAADCRAWAHQDGNTSTTLERAVRASIRRYAAEITRRTAETEKEQTK